MPPFDPPGPPTDPCFEQRNALAAKLADIDNLMAAAQLAAQDVPGLVEALENCEAQANLPGPDQTALIDATTAVSTAADAWASFRNL